jgi:hypothetical protein
MLAPALQRSDQVRVEFDGARGYGSSFLEEAFGGLLRHGFAPDEVLRKLELVASDSSIVEEVRSYIRAQASR